VVLLQQPHQQEGQQRVMVLAWSSSSSRRQQQQQMLRATFQQLKPQVTLGSQAPCKHVQCHQVSLAGYLLLLYPFGQATHDNTKQRQQQWQQLLCCALNHRVLVYDV
jgi:hypothetical protein